MPWDLDNNRPIYLQLMERIRQDIVAGTYKPGDKLPSELERDGLVYSKRTSGRYITEDETMLNQLKAGLAMQHIRQFLETMKQLGFKKEEIFSLIQEALKEDA